MFDVPPESVSSCVGLRPFNGRSSIRCWSITWEIEFSLVSTIAAFAVTCTLSVTDPICSVTGISMLDATCSVMPL